MKQKSYFPIVFGVITLAVAFFLTQQAVKRYRPPGAMTVIEAQSMDMSAMSAATPIGSIPVSTEEVSYEPFGSSITYTGTVLAFNDTELFPRVTGVLKDLYVYPGDRVKAGQLVARLDNRELASKANEVDALRIAATHDVLIATEEKRMASAQRRSIGAKEVGKRLAIQAVQNEISALEAARDQSEQESEAASIGIEEAQAGVDSAQADVEYWKSELSREEKLFLAKAVSREEFDREKAQARVAETKLIAMKAVVKEKIAMSGSAKSRVRLSAANLISAGTRTAQARAELKGAQADLFAAQTNENAYAHRVLHQEAMVNQAASQERTADIIRGYAEIRVDQDGVVTDRMVSPGTLVQPGTALLKIKDDSRVRLQASIATSDLSNVHVGSSVNVSKPASSTFRFKTRITSIFSAANAQTHTVVIEALTDNPNKSFIPGEYLSMEISDATQSSVLSVSSETILRDSEQKPYVWTISEKMDAGEKRVYTCVMHPEVVSDKPGKCPKCSMDLTPKNKSGRLTAHRQYVSLGASNGKRTVVKTGLSEGVKVINHGYESLIEDSPVTPVEWALGGPKSLPAASGEMSGMSMGGMKMGSDNSTQMSGMKMGVGNPSEISGMKMPQTAPITQPRPDNNAGMMKQETSKALYVCPMHPEVVSEKPGDCPKCHMKLKPKEDEVKKGSMDIMSGMSKGR